MHQYLFEENVQFNVFPKPFHQHFHGNVDQHFLENKFQHFLLPLDPASSGGGSAAVSPRRPAAEVGVEPPGAADLGAQPWQAAAVLGAHPWQAAAELGAPAEVRAPLRMGGGCSWEASAG